MEFNATFIVAFISFVVFIIVMNCILYSPINKIISERNKIIDDNYEEAKLNSLKAEAIIQQKNEEISSARTSLKNKIAKSTEEANYIKEERTAFAKKEANEKLKEEKNSLEQQKIEAKETLKTETINLAQLISDKILKNHEKIENIDNELLENIIQG